MSTTNGISTQIAALRRGAATIAALVEGLDDEQAHWRPADDRWSIVEVINHLADEEHEDFRMRFRMTLENPAEEWPPIDPQGAITARGYNARPLASSLEAFLAERERSLAWLASLGEVDLDRYREIPGVVRLSAGDLLTSWVAHDLLHVRQIVRLELEYHAERSKPYSPEYAG